MKNLLTAGLDWSMNSPSICIHDGSEWSATNGTFYYLSQKSKLVMTTDQLKGTLYKEYKSQQERFDNLSCWALTIMNDKGVRNAGLEGYSYGSSGSRLFEIGENTGLLKFKMWSHDINFEVYAPTSIKKFACGKGNAGKDKMWDAFIEETGLNIFHLLGQEVGKNWNPVSDMVDAYYMCKYRFENDSRKD